jgi:hypothetical protein
MDIISIQILALDVLQNVKIVIHHKNVSDVLMDMFYKIKELKEAINVLNAIKNVKHVQLIKINVHHVLMDINLMGGNAIKFLKLLWCIHLTAL